MASTAIVRSEVLYRVPRALLVRILGPFEAFFAARAVSLAELAATAQDDRSLVRAAVLSPAALSAAAARSLTKRGGVRQASGCDLN